MANPIPAWLIDDCPQGVFRSGVPYPTPAWYFAMFSQLGTQRPIIPTPRNISRLRADRNRAFRQIQWMGVQLWLYPPLVQRLNGMQDTFLCYDTPHQLRWYSLEVYNFCALAICGLNGNTFELRNMTDLYQFLLHMERGGAREHIQNLRIKDISSETLDVTKRTLGLLNLSKRGLVNLQIGYCAGCSELLCPKSKWDAWMTLRGLPANVTIALFPRTVMTFTGNPNNIHHCEPCRTRTLQGPSAGTRSAAWVGVQHRNSNAQVARRAALLNSLLRPA